MSSRPRSQCADGSRDRSATGLRDSGPVATTQPYIAVQALHAAGHPLATSKATAVKARLALFGGTAFASTTGMAGVFLGCFGSQACTGAMTITVGSTLLGERTRETIGAGDGAIVHIRPDERRAEHARPRTRRQSPRPRRGG